MATDGVAFLRHLHRQFGRQLLVILDRFNVPRKAARLLKQQGAIWPTIEWLPAYAPDLNPVEAMSSCTKYTDLANDTPANLDDLAAAATDSLVSQYGHHSTKRSYF